MQDWVGGGRHYIGIRQPATASIFSQAGGVTHYTVNAQKMYFIFVVVHTGLATNDTTRETSCMAIYSETTEYIAVEMKYCRECICQEMSSIFADQ